MRKFLLLILVFSVISTVYSACEYGSDVFNWTGRTPIDVNQWGPNYDEFGNLRYELGYVNETYIVLGQENMYMRFVIFTDKPIDEDTRFIFQINPGAGETDYFRIYSVCDEVTGILKKPTIGAIVNLTGTDNWNSIRNGFNISMQPEVVEYKISLDILGNPEWNIGFNFQIYEDFGQINGLDSWGIDICSLVDTVCGNDLCEDGEGNLLDRCRYCPEDCPELELTCSVGEPLTDWSDAFIVGTSGEDDVHPQQINGTDLTAMKVKVDHDKLYIKIELDSDEAPHRNITYGLRINPWGADIEYMEIRMGCQGIIDFVEKNSRTVAPINYTSNLNWNHTINNFTFSMTEHALEIAIPWYVMFYPNGMNLNAISSWVGQEANSIYGNIESIASFFSSICNDGLCEDEEADPYNRYQYCSEDCQNAPPPFCGNGECDEGEDSRWSPLQCSWDCGEFGKGLEQSPDGDETNPLMIIILIVIVIVVFITGISTIGKKLLGKLTAGKIKTKDLKKRLAQIDSEKKELQSKFMQTRISETEFKEKMSNLDREQQNIDLELKEKK